MKNRSGRVAAAGILCSIAATVALWSGPLASASRALHSSVTPQVSVSGATPAGR